jgi:hypothetical protein
MIESNFDYDVYNFRRDINFGEYYNIFTDFLNSFEETHSETLKNEEIKRLFKKCYKYKYMLKIICRISLFWFIYCVIYFNIQQINSPDHFDFIQHAIDRLYIFEKAYEEINKIKKN